MKLVFVSLLCMTLVGCGWFERVSSTVTGDPSKICVDGVTYLQFTSGATVQLDKTSKPVECK